MKDYSIYKIEDTIMHPRDLNWPIVYVLFCKDGGIYIGETNDLQTRMKNHNKKEWDILDRWVISHNKGNKSQAYLLESHLINYVYANLESSNDNSYILNRSSQEKEIWEGNNFFNREEFVKEIPELWNDLKINGLFKDFFAPSEIDESMRYNPFINLRPSQVEILKSLMNDMFERKNSYIHGNAGTGKTVLTIVLSIWAAEKMIESNGGLTIGLYSAKSKKSAMFERRLKKLSPLIKMRIKIVHTLNEKNLEGIDHLIIDEGQLLRKWFFDGARMPKHFEDGFKSDLAFIKHKGITHTIFYDDKQDVERYSLDVNNEFNDGEHYELKEQFRLHTKVDFMKFLENLFKQSNTEDVFLFDDYDIKSFDSQEELYEYTLKMNKKYNNKARLLSSISTNKWTSRDAKQTEENADFEIGDRKLHWNKSIYDWVENEGVETVGSIYSVHGADLEYAGVIFGDEIRMNDGLIEIDPKHYQRYKGGQVFKGNTEEEKYQKILNIYRVLLTRGSKGLGVYIPDPELREHFETLIGK